MDLCLSGVTTPYVCIENNVLKENNSCKQNGWSRIENCIYFHTFRFVGMNDVGAINIWTHYFVRIEIDFSVRMQNSDRVCLVELYKPINDWNWNWIGWKTIQTIRLSWSNRDDIDVSSSQSNRTTPPMCLTPIYFVQDVTIIRYVSGSGQSLSGDRNNCLWHSVRLSHSPRQQLFCTSVPITAFYIYIWLYLYAWHVYSQKWPA